MKLLATGDVHLGMKYSTYDEVREQLVDARFESLARCVEASREARCEVFAIAGDLFDRQNITQKDIFRTADILSAFEGQALLILPGNHDFYTGPQNRPWSELVSRLESRSVPVVLLSEPRSYNLEHFDLPLTVFPGPCAAKHSAANSISWIESEETAVPDHHLSIGIAHGSIEGRSLDSDGNYYPMSERQLRGSGVGVWIVGHTHVPFPDEQVLDPWLFIPGTPEPDGFDCGHLGGAWIVDLDVSGVTAVSRVDTGAYRFVDQRCTVQSLQDLDIVDIGRGDKTLLRLRLEGALTRDEYQDLGPLLSGIRKELFYFREDISKLEEVINTQTVEDEFSAESFSFRLLTGLLEDGDTQAAQIAYRIIRGMM